MAAPDPSTKEGIAAMSAACGSGAMILLARYLAVYDSNNPLNEYLSVEVSAILTGVFSFLALLLIKLCLFLRNHITYELNRRTLATICSQNPNNQKAKKALDRIATRRARDIAQ